MTREIQCYEMSALWARHGDDFYYNLSLDVSKHDGTNIAICHDGLVEEYFRMSLHTLCLYSTHLGKCRHNWHPLTSPNTPGSPGTIYISTQTDLLGLSTFQDLWPILSILEW